MKDFLLNTCALLTPISSFDSCCQVDIVKNLKFYPPLALTSKYTTALSLHLVSAKALLKQRQESQSQTAISLSLAICLH